MSVLADFRYSAKSLARTPALTAALLLTIALGIGSNAAVFGFIRGLVKREIPLPDSDRLVSIFARDAHDALGPISYDRYLALKTQADPFETTRRRARVARGRRDQRTLDDHGGGRRHAGSGGPPAVAASRRRHRQPSRLAERARGERDGPRSVDPPGRASTCASSGSRRSGSRGSTSAARWTCGLPLDAAALDGPDRTSQTFWSIGRLRADRSARQAQTSVSAAAPAGGDRGGAALHGTRSGNGQWHGAARDAPARGRGRRVHHRVRERRRVPAVARVGPRARDRRARRARRGAPAAWTAVARRQPHPLAGGRRRGHAPGLLDGADHPRALLRGRCRASRLRAGPRRHRRGDGRLRGGHGRLRPPAALRDPRRRPGASAPARERRPVTRDAARAIGAGRRRDGLLLPAGHLQCASARGLSCRARHQHRQPPRQSDPRDAQGEGRVRPAGSRPPVLPRRRARGAGAAGDPRSGMGRNAAGQPRVVAIGPRRAAGGARPQARS